MEEASGQRRVSGPDLEILARLVAKIEEAAHELVERACGIQAIERNARRILASSRILRLNVCDPLEL
jgi:hypothetical protein